MLQARPESNGSDSKSSALSASVSIANWAKHTFSSGLEIWRLCLGNWHHGNGLSLVLWRLPPGSPELQF